MAKKDKDESKDGVKRRNIESKFDEKGLRDMINAGKTADEIQQALGVVSRQSLRQHILKLITRDRKVYEVPGLYVRNLKRPIINVKGDIRLTKQMLDFPGSSYAPNDQFEIEIDNEKIILVRLSDETPPVQEDGDSSGNV
jgi:hypothetical protein